MTKTILVTLIVAAVSLVLLEVLLRMITQPWSFLDPRDPLFWLEVNREKLKDNASALGSNDTEYDAILGWRMKRNYSVASVNHDAHGYRVSSQLRQTNSNRPVTFFAGDSFTYGLGVANQETFASLLGAEIDVAPINAGVNAYGSDQALLMWENEGIQLDPDHLIFGYFADDFYRNGFSIRDAPKPHFEKQLNGELALRAGPVPSREAYFENLSEPRPLRLTIALKRIVDRNGHFKKRMPLLIEINRHILRRLRETTESSGVNLIVLVFGHCVSEDKIYRNAETIIVDELAKQNITYLNIAEEMRASPDFGALYGNNCHFSPKGHRFVANRLKQTLSTNSKDA